MNESDIDAAREVNLCSVRGVGLDAPPAAAHVAGASEAAPEGPAGTAFERWALVVIVTLKYVLLLLRADNNGEASTSEQAVAAIDPASVVGSQSLLLEAQDNG